MGALSTIESRIISASAHGVVSEYKTLVVGESVELEWEAPGQDGFDFRAVAVRRDPG